MKMYYCGFNGFKQWPDENLSVKQFTLSDKSYSNIQGCAIGWSHNIIQIGDEYLISGFHRGKPETLSRLTHPGDVHFSGVSCNENFALFYSEHEIWKYELNSRTRVGERWKLILNIAESGEIIRKVVSESRINIALTSGGNLYTLPLEMETSDCRGKIIDICCGHEHGIALTDLGNIYTWGTGSRCQLGHGSIEDSEHPRLVEALAGVKIVKIAAGGWHCSVISESGDLYTWGWNQSGQLGIPSPSPSPQNYALPILADFDTNVRQVSCGSKHTIVILQDGTLWGAGNNKYSQLGLTNHQDQIFPFRQIHVQVENPNILCKYWNSVIFSNKE